MVCALPAPRQKDLSRAGLQSVVENRADSSYNLIYGEAIATSSELTVFYNIYADTDLSALTDTPVAFSLETSTSLPKSLTGTDPFFAAKASQKGITGDFSNTNLISMVVSDTAYAYPDPTTTRFFYDADGYMPVNSVIGFPNHDGYIKIGQEIILYSDALDGYDGYGAFKISDRDPFGCNDGYIYNAGTQVYLFRGFEDGSTVAFKPIEQCLLPVPTWAESAMPGIESAGDLGIGKVVELHWNPALGPSGVSGIYYNIYYTVGLADLYYEPKAITIEQSVIIPELAPGDGYYFGIRAAYFPQDIDIEQMEQIGENIFLYPSSTAINQSGGYLAAQSGPLTVNSTAGFPDAGYIRIGSELLTYSGKTATVFIITSRDTFDFGQETTHADGSKVLLFKGIEEENINFYRSEPSWDRGENIPRLPVDPNNPSFNQDSDGYRIHAGDNLTEDHSGFENNNEDFNQFPYCGYRATNLVDLFSRNLCGTYFGGRQDGFGGGISLVETNLQRQEVLLGLTGEPFILLRKKWTGRQCAMVSHRHEHPHERCGRCFGTTFDGGYDRYFHPREIQPGVPNPNGFFMMRVSPYKNDLDRSPERGLTQIDEVVAWCTAIPFIKDSDIIVRYIEDPTLTVIREEFRYQVLYVNRNKLFFGQDGQQQITMKKMDKTDIIYTYPVPLI